MSLVVFRYENNKQFKKNGVGYTMKENIVEGDRGLSFMLVKKEGNNFHRISVREVSKDMFNIKEKKGDNETSVDKGLADIKKMVSENKDLAFVKNYIEKERGTYKGKESVSGGAKKASKKASKKVSKKVSKKASKKVSKKASKKTSNNTLFGGAKKTSNGKGSKKVSKKGSKKGSKKVSKKVSKKKH